MLDQSLAAVRSTRTLKGMSIGYATATRGGSHHDTRPPPQYPQGDDRRGTDGKPEFAVRSQHFTAVDDSLVLCRFTSERGFGFFVEAPYARMVCAVTGWADGFRLLKGGARLHLVLTQWRQRFSDRPGLREPRAPATAPLRPARVGRGARSAHTARTQ